MPNYTAPLTSLRFWLHEVIGLKEINTTQAFSGLDTATIDAVLDAAAQFAEGVLLPLNRSGDKEGAKITDHKVTMPKGFKEAYAGFIEGGWNGITSAHNYGGMGLPWMVSLPVSEMWNSANMAFTLCPLLTQGAIELLSLHGSEEQKEHYLKKLVSGQWTGTMCLTEPQAGSDLSVITTRAAEDTGVPGQYLLHGQKIFITYGDHDLTENIIHMVLARVAGAPEGTRGISLFIVPKILADGTPNDITTVSIEHKLGIHASPTAVLQFGEKAGAIGYRVGELHQGLKYMFTMMNNARIAVGMEGLGLAERSYQEALAYADERLQGKPIGGGDKAAAIRQHPDVARMLLLQEAGTEALRGMAMLAARSMDLQHHHPDTVMRKIHAARVALMTPVIKAHGTELGVEATSLAIQIHGGTGYIEETGIAQLYRDARIAPIYEGTNGIQALDLVFRKILPDEGQAYAALREALRDTELWAKDKSWGKAYGWSWKALDEATASLTVRASKEGAAAELAFIVTPYVQLFGYVLSAAMLVRAAKTAEKSSHPDKAFLARREYLAAFYVEHILPRAAGLCGSILHGKAYSA